MRPVPGSRTEADVVWVQPPSGERRGADGAAPIEDMEILDESRGVWETIARNEELEVLTAAIQSLPKMCRQIFTLSKVYGMAPKEVSKELELSLPTIYRQLSIGLVKCEQYMQSRGYPEGSKA